MRFVESRVQLDEAGPYLDLSSIFPDGVYAYLTLKDGPAPEPEALEAFLARRDRICHSVYSLKQIHSDIVVMVDKECPPTDGDGLVTMTPETAVMVKAADCVPVLMSSGDGRLLAAVHSGWKGTVSRIAERAVEKLDSPVSDISVYIGPGIGPCCYNVDRERYSIFEQRFPDMIPHKDEPPFNLDLKGIIAGTLIASGVREENLVLERRCSCCSHELCCSYRRDGDGAGRMAAVIGR